MSQKNIRNPSLFYNYVSWFIISSFTTIEPTKNYKSDTTLSNRCINTSIPAAIIWNYFQTKLRVPYKLNSILQNLNLYSCRFRLKQMNTANQSGVWVTGNISISSCTMLGPYENFISDIKLSY